MTPPSECPMSGDNATSKLVPTPPTKVIPSECPMHESNVERKAPAAAPPMECPMHQSNVDQRSAAASSASDCPSQDQAPIDPLNMMPPANQQPSPGQPFTLDTTRQTSTIPKGDPTGEGAVTGNWVYPSPQMFWNAMIRKGWRWEKDDLGVNDMEHIIRIHNSNNEEAWQEVMKWEQAFHPNAGQPKLVKFGGKAKEFSPRARFRSWLGYELPFDRHDWVVDRNGRHVRYIIDYYDVGDEEGYKNGDFVEMDVRPAFDSFGAAWDRSRACGLRWTSAFLQKVMPSTFGTATPSTEEQK